MDTYLSLSGQEVMPIKAGCTAFNKAKNSISSSLLPGLVVSMPSGDIVARLYRSGAGPLLASHLV